MAEASDVLEFERLFLALGDKTRLRLLGLMADGPVSVGFLADKLGDSQPKVSRHLAYLRNAGVVETTRDGKWIYYGIRYSDNAPLKRILANTVRAITSDEGTEDVHPAEPYEQMLVEEVSDSYTYVAPETYEPEAIQDGGEDEEIEWRPQEMDVFLL